MSITSFYFFVFCLLAILVYVVMPKKYRWVVLLVASVIFYLKNAPVYTGAYWFTAALTTYAAGLYLDKDNQKANSKVKTRKVVFTITLLINIAFVVALKYLNFCILNINVIGRLLGGAFKLDSVELIASLGISYYAFILIGYLCDVYWGSINAQKNPFKLFLFGCYFPQMVSGPISRYSEVSDELYEGKRVSYDELIFGFERIIWGLFKKLVVAGRLGVFVDTVYEMPQNYSAIYSFLATCAFALQLYSDFSGCMDIIMGVSECFGIHLPENFNAPFFSQNIQEFWQRWHITLGGWFKNYVMYPFLDTKLMIKLEGVFKKGFGKKKGKRYTSYIGMLAVWVGIGIWHGSGWKYIIGEGLWFWAMIILGKELKPVFDKVINLLKINKECFSWRLFRSLRTFVVFSIGLLFFRAPSLSNAKTIIMWMILGKKITAFTPITNVGLDARNWFICLLGLVAMLIVDYLHTKGDVRKMLLEQNLLFRWIVMLALIFAVILWGQYGPGYDATDFIYQGF